jgi:hypothetical protein
VHLGGSALAQGLEPVLTFEGVDRAEFEAAQDDIARNGPDLGIRIGRLDELADRGSPLGDPGSAIEKLCGFAKSNGTAVPPKLSSFLTASA